MWWRKRSTEAPQPSNSDDESTLRPRWPASNLGILNDKETDEVPGSVLLMPKNESDHNEPLGLHHARFRRTASSLPSPYPPQTPKGRGGLPRLTLGIKPPEPKRTADGLIILNPQPHDSDNDPLNWPSWRRNTALLSLGFFCMLGGGMTPLLAAGFSNVAATYDVSVAQVSLTTGLYMLGLGFGSVIWSPTAILWGKRPVYLIGGCLFVLSAVWCALSPTFSSLLVARVFQGIAVSPVECLPSATIAEIFFLHERGFRLGVYTLLLLGGKNLIPVISAAIINALGWQWVFWVTAIVVGFATILLFFFVPETFWDRTPRPSQLTYKNPISALIERLSPLSFRHHRPGTGRSGRKTPTAGTGAADASAAAAEQQTPHCPNGNAEDSGEKTPAARSCQHSRHAHFSSGKDTSDDVQNVVLEGQEGLDAIVDAPVTSVHPPEIAHQAEEKRAAENFEEDYFGKIEDPEKHAQQTAVRTESLGSQPGVDEVAQKYTDRLAAAPRRRYAQTLRPWNGRLRKDSWIKSMARPFVLFAYPAILWSALVYALSVGWLIVMSEAVTVVYRSAAYEYDFSALQAGLVYFSPFIGGVLGTAVGGRISDVIVRALSQRNGGVYEPEFRLLMAAPVLLTTVIGLMGFGWAAQNHDAWIVPTIFFGVISFGCSLGSTTAITFAVDSYREYAGEALVTLNFSKNVLHGFVFSFFFTGWLEDDGSKTVFLSIGGIQIFCLLFTIPLYIYGKRARMWTVRRNMMEKLGS